MVRTGRGAPHTGRVRLTPPAGTSDIEVNTLAGIRERGGPQGLLGPQGLDVDLVMRIESGTARHTVGSIGHHLGPGDILWVEARQVQQWGRIDGIEGPVVMFDPRRVDDTTQALIRAHAVRPRGHWAAADLEGSLVGPALDLLLDCADGSAADRSELHETALAYALALLLVQLSSSTRDSRPRVSPSHCPR